MSSALTPGPGSTLPGIKPGPTTAQEGAERLPVLESDASGSHIYLVSAGSETTETTSTSQLVDLLTAFVAAAETGDKFSIVVMGEAKPG